MKLGLHHILNRSDDDVVDRNEDELDEEADESHDDESNRGPESHLGEFFAIGLVAALDETNGVLGELSEGIHD